MSNKKGLTVFDSFAGAGGFSLGFSQAGYKIVGALEIDKWACDTYRYNHPNVPVIQEDITNVTNEELIKSLRKSIDVLLGGPPCQGFSIANRNNGDPKDPRNSLFTEFLRLGKLFTPKIIVMENVPNIINAKNQEGKKVVEIINDELKFIGYHTYYKVMQATDFGVPQTRRRFILVASKKPLKRPFPEAKFTLDSILTLWDAISDLPSLKAGEQKKEYKTKPQNKYQEMLRELSQWVENHKAMKHTKRLVERFKSMKWGQKGDELPEEHLPYKRNGNGLKSSAGYSQNNRRMYPDKPCHTIPASFYANFVHPYDDRNFTPREGARIQSFPDNYIFKGKETVVSSKLLQREQRDAENHLGQYSQIGNAVPPMMAKAIAENIIDNLS